MNHHRARFIVDTAGRVTDRQSASPFPDSRQHNQTSNLRTPPSIPWPPKQTFNYRGLVKLIVFALLLIVAYTKGGDYLCSKKLAFTSRCTKYVAIGVGSTEARMQNSGGNTSYSVSTSSQVSIGTPVGQLNAGVAVPLFTSGDDSNNLAYTGEPKIVTLMRDREPLAPKTLKGATLSPYAKAWFDDTLLVPSTSPRLRVQQFSSKIPSAYLGFKVLIFDCRFQSNANGGRRFGCAIKPELEISFGSFRLKAGVTYQIRLDTSSPSLNHFIEALNGQKRVEQPVVNSFPTNSPCFFTQFSELADTKPFSAKSASLIGKWQHVECYRSKIFPNTYPSVRQTLTATFSKDGELDITASSTPPNSEKTRWKYTANGNDSGTLEQYKGSRLLYRGNVKWLSRNRFHYTNTFNYKPDMVGQQYTYTRQ